MLTTHTTEHIGQVRYVTQNEIFTVTVECPTEKMAFKFKTKEPFRVGKWLKIAETEISEKTVYYHQPFDGSCTLEWGFRELLECSFVEIGCPDFNKDAHEAMLRLRRHLDSWKKNFELSQWGETRSALARILSHFDSEIADRKPEKIAAPDISDL